MLHDFSERLTLGVEFYGGFSWDPGAWPEPVGRRAGRWRARGSRKGLTFNFGLLGGRYIASPRIGAQIGFAVDFPTTRRPARKSIASRLF